MAKRAGPRNRRRFQPDLSKLNEQQLAAYRQRICVVCLKNVGRLQGYLFCETCEKLVTAEKTRERYGADKTRDTLEASRNQFIANVIRLNKLGLTQTQIAAEIGIGVKSLSNMLYRLRQEGFKIPYMYCRIGRPPKVADAQPPRDAPRARNEHGGGAWGVKDCHCQPCLDVRRRTRRKYHKLRKAQAKKLKLEAQKTPRG